MLGYKAKYVHTVAIVMAYKQVEGDCLRAETLVPKLVALGKP